MDKLFSLSHDFKTQYTAREKDYVKIDQAIKKFKQTFDCITTNNLWFKKIKFYLRIEGSTEIIQVLVLSSSKVIFRRFE
jgi:hypothetical protein